MSDAMMIIAVMMAMSIFFVVALVVAIVVVVYRMRNRVARETQNMLAGLQQPNGGGGVGAAEAAALLNRIDMTTAPGTAPLLSPSSTREEVEAFARAMRSSQANRRAAEREQRGAAPAPTTAANAVSSAAVAPPPAKGSSDNDASAAAAAATPASAPAPKTDGGDTDEADEAVECSVCLCEAEAAVEFLPCGHSFCGKCAQQLWRHGGVMHRMVCPLDRQSVEAIVPNYALRDAFDARIRRAGGTAGGTDRPQAPLSAAAIRAIDADLARYNNNNTQRTVAGMIALAMRTMSLAQFMPFIIKLKVFCLFIVPILYTISPVDFIPELVFGLAGYLDDAILVIVCVVALAGVARDALGMRGRA